MDKFLKSSLVTTNMSNPFNLKIGTVIEIERIVEKEHCAPHLGPNNLVLSTPAMILFMEQASSVSVEDQLPDGFQSVGTVVNIRHLNAVIVGSKVISTASLVDVDRKRLVFDVEVKSGNLIVGKGVHERFIVKIDQFIKALKSVDNNGN